MKGERRKAEGERMGRGRAEDKKARRMGEEEKRMPKPKNWVSSGEKAQTTRVAIVATYSQCFLPRKCRQGSRLVQLSESTGTEVPIVQTLCESTRPGGGPVAQQLTEQQASLEETVLPNAI